MKTFPTILLLSICAAGPLLAQVAKLQRGESVIDAPAVGEGLCVHNLFQSNMVLQRDKPLKIWGWASPGEQVSVSFAGQKQAATAAESARKAEIPSISGGSPTAFDRCIVSSTFRPSHSATLKTRGRSDAQGIL